MLFRKKIPGSCQYCAHGVRLEGGQIVCVKKGLLEGDCACRRFHYDPLKRISPNMTRRIFLSEFPRDLLEGGMVKTCPFLQQIPFFLYFSWSRPFRL